jgi:Ca2+-transporting ATPase
MRLVRIWIQPVVPLLLLTTGGFFVLGQRLDAVLVALVTLTLVAIQSAAAVRAQGALASVAKLSAPRALAWRDGQIREMVAEDLVVEDVVLLQSGTRVPADLRLVEADRLIVDESLVTGESQPVEYGYGSSVPPDAFLKAGTQIVRGGGVAVVTATGMSSTLGHLAALTEDTESARPAVEVETNRLVWVLLAVAAGAAVAVTGVALLRHQPVRAVAIPDLRVLFAAAPADLIALVVISLLLGAGALARRGALLRQPSAAETLATITLVCADKTGTLTENRIDLSAVVTASRLLESPGGTDRDAERVKRFGKLASEPAIQGDSELGDPIDKALNRASTSSWPEPVARFGFDSGRRLASAVVEVDSGLLLGVKGAPEAVLVRCAGWRSSVGVVAMDETLRGQALATAQRLAGGGARVLAVASRVLSGPDEVNGGPSRLERELVLEGLLAFSDCLRSDVPEAVRDILRDGVGMTMVTGDQAATAESTARQAGLGGPVFIAAQTNMWTDSELAERVTRGCIIARARPEDKLRVVRAAASAGEIVAVTGDGANDVPALEAANLGVAMGRGGTDVARDAAGLVLAQDSFTAFAEAAVESRRLHANLRKAIRFCLSVKLALVTVLVVSALAGLAMPFGVGQVILIEILTLLGASIAFFAQPPEVDELRRRPRNPRMGILERQTAGWIVSGWLILSAVTVGGYWFVSHGRQIDATTLALACFLVGLATLGIVMAWERRPVAPRDVPANLALFVWFLAVVAGAALPVLVAPAAAIAHAGTVPLSLALPALGAALLAPLVMEVSKYFRGEARVRR